MSLPRTNPASLRVSWLQEAVALGAALHRAHVARRLRQGRTPVQAQDEIWRRLKGRLAKTAFGRAEGIEPRLSYKEFQTRVAPRTYEQFVPWVERMKRGESDVLWPGRCRYYALSSGTTAGRTKYLPLTPEMFTHFRRTGLESLCHYAHRTGSREIFRGRHLLLGGSTSLARLPESGSFKAWGGDLSGLTALHLPRWVERHLYEPGRKIAQMGDWPEKLRAIANRTAARDVRMIAGIPSWILIFAETMRRATGQPTLKDTWPGLECLVCGGVPVTPFAAELREVLGSGVQFHEVYPASEGFIASQDAEPEAGLRLAADAGVFYEFLPMNRFDESRLSELGGEAVPLDAVLPGVNYALVMTTPGGLCRYVIGDVVRFISTEPPRLVYVGRTRLQLSAFGEHVTEKEVTDALTAVCAQYRATIVNFHVAPQFAEAGTGRLRGRHEWWVELRSPGEEQFGVITAAASLDLELQRLNDDYAAKRKGHGLDLPVVRMVPAGTFERWLKSRGKWGGQNKLPRCRSDREIADELAKISENPTPPARPRPVDPPTGLDCLPPNGRRSGVELPTRGP